MLSIPQASGNTASVTLVETPVLQEIKSRYRVDAANRIHEPQCAHLHIIAQHGW